MIIRCSGRFSALPFLFALAVMTTTTAAAGETTRAIGINYFDCFMRTLIDGKDTSYAEGFRVLGERGIPFARFCATGYWPADMRLYQEDRVEYFRRLDAVVAAAREQRVGLIPCLFWAAACVPDLMGEPLDCWGDPASRTQGFMRDYVREVVTRYRDDPTIWAWEFGNEYSLSASLPNASEHRPPTHPKRGTPATRSARDELTMAMTRAAFTAFANEVRKYDATRPLLSGDAFPRPSAWNQEHRRTWSADTPEQADQMLTFVNPAPLTGISIHVYGDDDLQFERVMRVAKRLGRTVFVGEFGVPGTGPEQERHLRRMLRSIIAHDIAWAALWVYDLKNQPEHTVTTSNARAWQLELIAEANRELRQKP